MKYEHIPVMLSEAIEYLEIKKDGFYIDCTLGGSGYTLAIAKRIGDNGKVLAIDLDRLAISNAKSRIKNESLDNIVLVKDNFSKLGNIIDKAVGENQKFNGIVMDLGLSSAQLDDRNRGISFKDMASPINMAFGETNQSTADILNYYSQADLEKVIKEYGEERFAKRISEKIVKARINELFKNVRQLVEIIEDSIPAKFQSKSIHPATKTFQALRIETNKELESLKLALPQAVKSLKKGGRIVIVSYHSLEDRIVKNFFKSEARKCICPKEAIICDCNHSPNLKIITKKPVVPSTTEIQINNRARSAKMRVAKKL